jgi:hypothetical protein
VLKAKQAAVSPPRGDADSVFRGFNQQLHSPAAAAARARPAAIRPPCRDAGQADSILREANQQLQSPAAAAAAAARPAGWTPIVVLDSPERPGPGAVDPDPGASGAGSWLAKLRGIWASMVGAKRAAAAAERKPEALPEMMLAAFRRPRRDGDAERTGKDLWRSCRVRLRLFRYVEQTWQTARIIHGDTESETKKLRLRTQITRRWVRHPERLGRYLWDFVQAAFLVYIAFATPFRVCFDEASGPGWTRAVPSLRTALRLLIAAAHRDSPHEMGAPGVE